VPFFRWLPVILVMGLFFLDGCLGRSQTPRFYTLSPITEDKAMVKSDTPARDTRIGIGPIKLAKLSHEIVAVIHAAAQKQTGK